MNYNEIDISNYNFDTKFIKFISLYQNQYKNKVLQNNSPIPNTETTKTSKKRDLKDIIEDFFFSPKYDNVLDIIKFRNKKVV